MERLRAIEVLRKESMETKEQIGREEMARTHQLKDLLTDDFNFHCCFGNGINKEKRLCLRTSQFAF